MLSRQLLYLVLFKRDFCFLSFREHQLSRFLLSPAFPQLLYGWLLHHPPVLHVGQPQAGSVLEVRKHVTGLGAMLLGFVVWIWCHENSAPHLPDQSYSASSWLGACTDQIGHYLQPYA